MKTATIHESKCGSFKVDRVLSGPIDLIWKVIDKNGVEICLCTDEVKAHIVANALNKI